MSQAIVFQPGQTTQPFTVDIVPNEIPEPSEFFNVMANTSQQRVLLTAPSLPLVEIIDDDSECSNADLSVHHWDYRISAIVLVVDERTWVGSVGDQCTYLLLSHLLMQVDSLYMTDPRCFEWVLLDTLGWCSVCAPCRFCHHLI